MILSSSIGTRNALGSGEPDIPVPGPPKYGTYTIWKRRPLLAILRPWWYRYHRTSPTSASRLSGPPCAFQPVGQTWLWPDDGGWRAAIPAQTSSPPIFHWTCCPIGSPPVSCADVVSFCSAVWPHRNRRQRIPVVRLPEICKRICTPARFPAVNKQV